MQDDRMVRIENGIVKEYFSKDLFPGNNFPFSSGGYFWIAFTFDKHGIVKSWQNTIEIADKGRWYLCLFINVLCKVDRVKTK